MMMFIEGARHIRPISYSPLTSTMLIEGLHYTCTCGCVREQINYVFAFVENMYCVDKLHLHSHLMTFIYRSRSYVGKKHVLLSSLCL